VTGLVGQALGRYEIVALIGRGGMGEVFRARDTELGRDVAVKVITDQAADNRRALERFEREAKTVAQLSHPNILEIFDFGREDGVVYAVTEFLEGGDLRSRTQGKELPLSKILEIGISVANGLAAAHSKGIIHRDIKPENVFVTSTGQVKILDFGIAGLKDSTPTGEVDPNTRTQSLTGTGAVIGTVGYMSPEQVRGEKVDSRSDIFAFGCLIYELLTGRRAFQRDTPHHTMEAILNSDPVPISEFRPDVAPALEMIVARCLEKQPAERFESARDIAFALQTLTGARKAHSGAHPALDKSAWNRSRSKVAGALVVLVASIIGWVAVDRVRSQQPLPEELCLGIVPFEVLDQGAEMQDFSAGLGLGMTEDLTLISQQERGISWVIPPARAAQGGDVTVQRLGHDFGATVVVTGQLESVGERVRLTLNVVAPSSDSVLRRTVIEDTPSNVEAFQHGPARRVAEMLGVSLAAETQERIDSWETTTTGVFDLFTRGRGRILTAEDSGEIRAALPMIEEAVGEDPMFAGGWVTLAESRLELSKTTDGMGLINDGLEEVERAIGVGGGRPEAAWRVKAALYNANGDVEAAIEALRIAIRHAPEDPELYLELAGLFQSAGRLDEAETQIQRSIYLRPDYWVGYDVLAKLRLMQGKLEAAAIEFSHIIDCVPGYALGYVKLAGVYMYLERPEAALPLLEESVRIETTPSALTNLGSIHFDSSRFAQAAEYYKASIEMQPDNYVLWGNLAYAHKYGVEPDEAEAAFRRAIELASELYRKKPEDFTLAAVLAGYHAMVGEDQRGRELLDPVAAAEPTNPMIVPLIAETYEDLGERELALEWVSRSFDAGLPPSRFQDRPTLSRLVADERFRELVARHEGAS